MQAAFDFRFRHSACIGLLVCMALGTVARAQLPPPPEPPENPITPQKAILGKILFWDEQLSSDNTVACGTCHRPAAGGADPAYIRRTGPDGKFNTPDDLFGSAGMLQTSANGQYLPSAEFGFLPQVTGRQSMSFVGAQYFTQLFWDGRAADTFLDPESGKVSIVTGGGLESQAVGPPMSDVEMAHQGRNWTELTQKLRTVKPMALSSRLTLDMLKILPKFPTYPELFRYAFGDDRITGERIAFALATYERTLIPDQSRWDLYNQGDTGALNETEKKGLTLFLGKANCFKCHPPPLFSDDMFHNIGVRPPDEDYGLMNVTGQWSDRGKFRSPSLRNVGLRRRQMHNARFGDLNQVTDFYNRGGDFSDNIDPLMAPLGLTNNERIELYHFMSFALTDPRLELAQQPFDRPLLHNEGTGSVEVFGVGAPGSNGLVPEVIARTPANLGNPSFKIGVSAGLGGAPALLLLGAEPAASGDQYLGVPLYVGTNPPPLLLQFTLQGSGAGDGYANLAVKLTGAPGLAGLDFFLQWIVFDVGAATGVCGTPGVKITLF